MSERQVSGINVLGDWNIAELPNGLTRMESPRPPMTFSGYLFTLVLMGGFWAAIDAQLEFWAAIDAQLVVTLCWLPIAALIGYLAWMLPCHEVWLVGSDLLEIRQTLGRWSRNWRYTGATLSLSFETDGMGGTNLQLLLECRDVRRTLHSRSSADPYALGSFLAQRTGWPLYLTSERQVSGISVLGDWNIAELPNGLTRMESKESMTFSGCLSPLVLMGMFWVGVYKIYEAGAAAFVVGLVALPVAGLTGWFARELSRKVDKVEWLVGSDLLEIRQTLGRWSRNWRYTGATLSLSFETDGMGGTNLQLLLECRDVRRTLHSRSSADPYALGSFLAQRTGWPLRLPRELQEAQA